MNAWIGGFITNFILKHFIKINSTIFTQLLQLLLSLLIAILIYWFVDKKILTMRSKLYTEKRAKVVTVIAYASVFIGIFGGFILKFSIPAN